jgi:YD repeat-containing protein
MWRARSTRCRERICRSLGLLTSHEQRELPSHASRVTTANTWTADAAGNLYIGTLLTTLDGSLQKKSVQAMDSYGNLTSLQLFDFGNLSTPVRTYTNTYLSDPNYTSRYIRNRLVSSIVQGPGGSPSVTLLTNTYDLTTPTDVPGMTSHDPAYGTAFNFRGNVWRNQTPGGVGNTTLDIGGNPVSVTVNGVTTTPTINGSTNWAAPSAITTGSWTTTMNYTSFLGLSSETGPNGDTASMGYDSSARPQTTTSPFGAVTTYSYSNSPPSKTATTNGHWVKSSMDGFGRTIKTETGDAAGTKSTVDVGYDSCGCSPLGKMVKQSLPYAPGGTVYWTNYTYDGLGRTVSVAAPDASASTYAYLTNTVMATDAAGKWKKFTTDALGNLTQVQEPDPALGTVSTNYTYDVLKHLVGVSMPRGSSTQSRTFNYGNPPGVYLLSATNPETGTVTYSYNTDNTLHSKTDANGVTTVYNYDAYQRVTSVVANGVTLRTYSYDTNPYDSTYSQYAAGRLTAVQYTRSNGDTFTDMFSYAQPGSMAGKRLRVARTLWTGARLSADIGSHTDMTMRARCPR